MPGQAKFIGVAETVQRLKNLPTELSGKNGGPIRAALFQGAKVIQTEAQRRVPVRTGRLKANIIKLRDRNPRQAEGSPTEIYHIGVRGGGAYGGRVRRRERRKVLAAGGSSQQASRAAANAWKDAWYWWFVENGTSKMPAQPYLRPAFDAKKDEVVRVFAAELDKAISKLERTV